MDKVAKLEKIAKLAAEMAELVDSFCGVDEFRIANDLSGEWITLEEAIERLDGKDDRH
jgi:hypothetical protein